MKTFEINGFLARGYRHNGVRYVELLKNNVIVGHRMFDNNSKHGERVYDGNGNTSVALDAAYRKI